MEIQGYWVDGEFLALPALGVWGTGGQLGQLGDWD